MRPEQLYTESKALKGLFMGSRSLFIAMCALWTPAAYGQLHLMTGSPWAEGTDAFPSALLRVNQNGTVSTSADLVSATVGTAWIGVSYDLRKAVVLTRSDFLIVVDFDEAKIVKRCAIPDSRGRSLIQSWLANPPTP